LGAVGVEEKLVFVDFLGGRVNDLVDGMLIRSIVRRG